MAGASAIWPVQVAIYSLLSTDATLLGLATGGVWDAPRTNLAPPYVVLLEAREVDDSTFGRLRKKVDSPIEVWSLYQGTKEEEAIATRIAALLHRTKLSITGWNGGRCIHQATQPRRENDGRTRVDVMAFRTWVEQA